MNKVARTSWFLGLLALALAALAPARAQRVASDVGAHLVVIVSARNPTRSLSYGTVRDIFLGVPTFVKVGEPYLPLSHPPESPMRVAFDQQFLGLDPDAVGRYWVDQRIRARATPPRTISSVDTLRRVVATLPQAISYVRADALRPGVLPVAIDGIDFRDPGYRYKLAQLMGASASCTTIACAAKRENQRDERLRTLSPVRF